MGIFYSASTGGVYHSDDHADMPQDAVEISEKEYQAILDAPSKGKMVAATKAGKPKIVDMPEAPEKTAEQILLQRKTAYAAESDPLFIEWQYDLTPEAEQAWRDKVKEIKERYPLP